MTLGFGDRNRMLKQVQKLQADMRRLQEEAGSRTAEASAGGGVVRATANGNGELTGLTIDPTAVDPSDVEMLQDLVLAAANEAIRQAREQVAAEMAKLTGGLRLPGAPFA